MKYELAKQLKDAGFPQETRCECCSQIHDDKTDELIVFPTLSELIEACGDKFMYLTRNYHFAVTDNPKLWRATATEGFMLHDIEGEKVPCDPDCCGWTEGEAPEEALAKLWLALNEKK